MNMTRMMISGIYPNLIHMSIGFLVSTYLFNIYFNYFLILTLNDGLQKPFFTNHILILKIEYAQFVFHIIYEVVKKQNSNLYCY